MLRTLAAACAGVFCSPALAQPLFANPFAEAAEYRAARSAPEDARYRVRYEVTRSEFGQAPETSEFVIDVAADWSLTRTDGRASLRDFRVNRMFSLEADRFMTMNGLADLTFRVMERQNRDYLRGLLAATGAIEPVVDDCDADAELGLALPGAARSETSLRRDGARVALSCGDREIGAHELSGAPAPPAAFWPTMFAEMSAHPVLHQSIRESGSPPSLLETSFRLAPDSETRYAWRLLTVETVVTPYPLTDDLDNATSHQLDELLFPGASQLAVDAVAGRAQGGAPTLESWGEHLDRVRVTDGLEAALMLMLPTLNMFPELVDICSAASGHPYCAMTSEIRSADQRNTEYLGVLEIGMAEQRGDPAAAVAAMERAYASQHRDHPALGASWALAVLALDEDALNRARTAGLPLDVAALQARAVAGLPYNPAYWTDIGDRYAANYRWDVAFLTYDIAYSLPMPSAVADNRALVSKRSAFERIRNDFPDAGLPR